MKRIEIALRNLILKVFLFFNSAKSESGDIKLNHINSILCIRLNRIGDALVSTAFLELLKKQGKFRITVLADKKNHFVFRNCPSVDEVIIYEKKPLKAFAQIHKLNKRDFTAVIDLHDDTSTTVSMIISLLKIPYKVAIEKTGQKIYTNTVQKPEYSKTHVIDRLLCLSPVFGITPEGNININYKCLPESINFAFRIIESVKLPGKKIAGINISAGSDARFWGDERFRQTADLLSSLSFSVIIITAPKDISKAEMIAGNTYNTAYSNNFDEFAAVISMLDFLFTPDTSAVHLASAFNIPMFGIYVKYNTSDMIWYPYASAYDCVITEEEDLQNVSFEDVKEKLINFIKKVEHEKRNTGM